LEILKFW